jgi:hypothetical protein
MNSGFHGETRVQFEHRSGRECSVAFPTQILDCDGGLFVVAESSASIDDACQRPVNAGVVQHSKIWLVRFDGGGSAPN